MFKKTKENIISENGDSNSVEQIILIGMVVVLVIGAGYSIFKPIKDKATKTTNCISSSNNITSGEISTECK